MPRQKESQMKTSIFLAAAISALTIMDLSAQVPTQSPAATVPPPPSTFAAPNLTPLGARALAVNCSACHGTNGNSAGGAIAGLAGMNKEYLVGQMKFFKEGKREATLMHQIAKGYSDAEIAAMADFFAAQKK